MTAGAAFVSSNRVDAATAQSAYTVKAGDTLSAIANANDTTVAKLVSANSIQNEHLIHVGQQLKLSEAATTYTVKSGDTLGAIAEDTKVTVANLVTYNNITDANFIHVGQVLKLTGTTATTAAAATTTSAQATTPAASTQTAATTTPATTSQATTTQSTTTSATTNTTPAASTTTAATAQANTTTSTTTSYGSFKLSFYDPAVLGSNLGYSGVAANLSVFPKGTKLKITLSNGTVWYRTVNDTGSFAQSNSHQLDVAMPSSQIPSAGILYAQVSVVK
ncbi:LysM peptidoglycan-binding domain-containing protein [Lacticaseibacillus porcinae]|uniref:LysM peptidoglycan-binding domain-containing protein n=1 Tax=Lacticaseibacillus porcinae TaxID=1123687 RepID=UPI000F78C8B2